MKLLDTTIRRRIINFSFAMIVAVGSITGTLALTPSQTAGAVEALAPTGLKFVRGGQTLLDGSSVNTTDVTLQWNRVEGASRYRVAVTDPSGATQSNRNTGTPTFALADSTRHGFFGSQQGLWSYKVQALDSVTNTWFTSNAATLKYDSVGPQLAAPITQTYQSRDGGRVSVLVKFNEAVNPATVGQGWYPVANTGNTQFTKVYFATRAQTATFADLLGNTSTISFTSDLDRPVITAVTSSEGGVATNAGNISVVATDNLGLRKVSFTVEGTSKSDEFSVVDGATSATLTTAIAELGLADGSYVIKAAAEDLTGQFAAPVSIPVTIDNDNPFATDIALSKTSVRPVETDLKLTLQVSDTASNVSSFAYRLFKVGEGNATTPVTDTIRGTLPVDGVFDEKTESIAVSLNPRELNLSDGKYRIQMYLYDATGRQGKAQAHFVVDSIKPVVTVASPTVNGFNPSQIVVNATDEQGLNRVTANIYDSTNTRLIAPCSEEAFGATSFVLNCNVNLTDGKYVVRVNANDFAGNVAQTITVPFVIDRTAPTLTLKEGSDYTVGGVSAYQKVSFKLHDAGVGVKTLLVNGTEKNLTVNNWSDANYLVPGVDGVIEGRNTIVLYDAAGNASEPYVFVIDTVTPGITASVVLNGKTLTATAEVTDAAPSSGIEGIGYQLLNAEGDAISEVQASSSFDLSEFASSEYSIRVLVLDNAGNFNSVDTSAVFIDNNAPEEVTVDAVTSSSVFTGTVSESAEVTVTITRGDEEVESGLAVIEAIEEDGSIMYRWSYTTSTTLDEGDYVVSVIARDAAGNATPAATQSFTVAPATVTPPTGPTEPIEEPNTSSPLPNSGAPEEQPTTTSDNTQPSTPALIANVVTPVIVSPAAAAVLGATTEDNEAEVEGAATTTPLAAPAAVDTDATDGTIFGLAWYWWLLILAAIAAIVGWIIAAVRRRQEA